MQNLEPHLEKRILESFARQKLMTSYGATITAAAKGFVEISLLPQDFLLRTAGIFHGGVITALADTAGGYAAGTVQETDSSFLTVELKINFLNPARGEKLITRGRVLKGGRTLTVVQTDSFIQNEGAEKLVATALITFIRENRPS